MSGMLEQRVDRHLVAVHDVEDAVGHARLGEQLGREHRGRRILLGRLEDEGVPARERRRPHPHRDHRGEVERRDPGDDAERLADRVDVDPGRGLLREAALEQRRDPAAELDHLEPARHLAHRVGEHLAVLGGEQPREVLAVRVEELADPEEQLGAPAERERAPGGERLLRGLDGEVDLLDGAKSTAPVLHARRRVVDRADSARAALVALAADPVIDRPSRPAVPRSVRSSSPPRVVPGRYRVGNVPGMDEIAPEEDELEVEEVEEGADRGGRRPRTRVRSRGRGARALDARRADADGRPRRRLLDRHPGARRLGAAPAPRCRGTTTEVTRGRGPLAAIAARSARSTRPCGGSAS